MNFRGEIMRVAAVVTAASLTLAAAVSVTACSPKSTAAASGSTPAAASATSASAAAADATSAAAAGGSGSSGSVTKFNVCKALSAAAASQITGTTFTTVKAQIGPDSISSCEYDGANAALLQITVNTTTSAAIAKDLFNVDVSALKTVGHPANSVQGVGDEAFSEPDPKGNAGSVGASAYGSYGAVFGVTYIKIGGLTYVTPSQGKQIVEELNGKL
jgi:hypothetical protein